MNAAVVVDVSGLEPGELRAIEAGVLANVTAGAVLRIFPALNIPEDDLFPAVDRVLALVAD